MVDERDLLKRIIASAEVEASEAVGPRQFDKREDCRLIVSILDRALATQPEPGGVPELPEYVTGPDEHGDYWVQSVGGLIQFRANATSAETHERLAETHHILAARQRARRAGS